MLPVKVRAGAVHCPDSDFGCSETSTVPRRAARAGAQVAPRSVGRASLSQCTIVMGLPTDDSDRKSGLRVRALRDTVDTGEDTETRFIIAKDQNSLLHNLSAFIAFGFRVGF